MNNHEQEVYALQDGDGNLIGIDRESGGYPWTPQSLLGVWFTDKASAENYMKVGSENFKLVRVKVILEEV